MEPAGSATPADRPAIVAYLAEGRDHFTQLKARADGIRKSPIAAGDEVTANLRAKLGDLAAIGSPSLQDLAERHPEVTQARKQAENC